MLGMTGKFRRKEALRKEVSLSGFESNAIESVAYFDVFDHAVYYAQK